MANHNPKPHLVRYRFKSDSDRPLGKRVTLRIFADQEAAMDGGDESQSDRIRRYIDEGLQRDKT